MSRVICNILQKGELKERDITEMFRLLDTFCKGASPTEFLRSLSQKDMVLVLKNDMGKLRGFATQKVVHLNRKDKSIHGILTGDIVTDGHFAGSQEIWKNMCMLYQPYQRKYGKIFFLYSYKDSRTRKFLEECSVTVYPAQNQNVLEEYKKIHSLVGKYYFTEQYQLFYECSPNRNEMVCCYFMDNKKLKLVR